MADDKSSCGGKNATSSQASARDHVSPSASEDALPTGESELLEEIVLNLRRQPREPLEAAKQEAAKRDILKAVSTYQQMARILPPKRKEGREQLERVVNAAEEFIKALEATECLPVSGLRGTVGAMRSAQIVQDSARSKLQLPRWRKKDGPLPKTAERELIQKCFEIFDPHRPGKASTYEKNDFVNFVEGTYTLATGKDKRFDWLIKDQFPSLRAWEQEVRDQRRIGHFNLRRRDYGGKTVAIYVEGTKTLAKVYNDEDMTSPAANPQTLDSITDNGTIYGSWKEPIYTDEKNIYLDIEGEIIGLIKQP